MHVRNESGIWVNVAPLREAALHFEKHGTYCAEPEETPAWYEYWKRERERCIRGHTVSGVRITGDHYFYLNYSPIQKALSTGKRVTSKVSAFPDFWDGDYNYFWVRELARNGVNSLLSEKEQQELELMDGEAKYEKAKKLLDSLFLDIRIQPEHLFGGYNLIVGKARRRGYSYKNAAIAANNFFSRPRSLTLLNAYEARFLYPKGLFSMVVENIHFVNTHTAWTMPSDVVNKASHIRASYIAYRNGVKSECGFKSEVMALSCKDNPGVNRGKDAYDIFVEEAGSFGSPGLLKELYASSEDCVRAGMLKTGLITVFGTSGEMEGGSADYADMHTRPSAFGFLPLDNVWDDAVSGTQCGFFHPISWNLEGFYDENGNSDRKGAESAELAERDNLKRSGASSVEIQRRMQEKPLTPREAFSITSVSIFPVIELKERLAMVRAKGWQRTKGTPVRFSREGRVVRATPILDGSAMPIVSLNDTPANLYGCPIIYEYPDPDARRGMYKIGYDPVRQDTGTSLAAIIVYKSFSSKSLSHSCIVAEYVGRGAMSEDTDIMAEYFADFYNTTIMYENEVIGTKNYFRRIKRLNLLASQPDLVISKNVKKSHVSRIYGCHMVPLLKDAGERYVKDWLLTVLNYDEHGNPVRVIDTIYSERLLEELISYRRGGNYDLISALFMCMFQVQEELEGKDYAEDPKKKRVKELLDLRGRMFRKQNGSLYG